MKEHGTSPGSGEVVRLLGLKIRITNVGKAPASEVAWYVPPIGGEQTPSAREQHLKGIIGRLSVEQRDDLLAAAVEARDANTGDNPL